MIKPYGNNIYIEPIKEDSPLKQAENSSITERGVVLAVADSVDNIKIGDVIFFNAFLANKVEVEGKSYYFVQNNGEQILAVDAIN